MVCRICGSKDLNDAIHVKEMMIPTYEVFNYVECRKCHCLQIEEIPSDLERYYGPGYYSFQPPELEMKESGQAKEIVSGGENDKVILDVGCGAGDYLTQLRRIGYKYLFGCDPFLQHDLAYGEEIKIYKKTIHEMDGSYDMIFMNDSFEHVTDPHEVMESIKRLLAPNGIARIAIPVYPNVAYDMFGTDWYQLDAPRHIYLHSEQSMELLALKHDLQIAKVEYDSNASQIFRSYLYSKGIPFHDQKMRMLIEEWGEQEVEEIEQVTKEANERKYGDHAVFYLMHREADHR